MISYLFAWLIAEYHESGESFSTFFELNFHVSFHFFGFCELSGVFFLIVRRDANALQSLFSL